MPRLLRSPSIWAFAGLPDACDAGDGAGRQHRVRFHSHCLFLLEWFYLVVFELSLAGATPGKRVMGIAVVMDNGLPVNDTAASITRNLLRAADFFRCFMGSWPPC